MLKVRERGKFWLRRLHITDFSIQHLKENIKEKFSHVPFLGEIYSIYELWDRNHVELTESRLKELDYGHELEVIFTKPASKERGSYSRWWYKAHRNQDLQLVKP